MLKNTVDHFTVFSTFDMIHFVKNPSTMLKREAKTCKNNKMANVVGVLYASGDIAPQSRKIFQTFVYGEWQHLAPHVIQMFPA